MFRHLTLGFAALLLGACRPELSASEGGEIDTDGDAEPTCGVADSPRLVRLTHEQYDNSVRDLLGVDLEPSSEFLADPEFSGFDNNAEGLTVPDRLARDYRRAAEELSKAVADDPQVLGALLSCDPASGTTACAEDFIVDFGARAYRRPLGDDEKKAYLDLYTAAEGSYETGSAFEQGTRLVIETMLQSPRFLYRVELSNTPDDSELVPLDGHEVASRLSFLLWNSAPDRELLEAAGNGELDELEGIEVQARRLLDDPRAASSIEDFHAQWLRVDEYQDLTKDEDLYPGLAADISGSMAEETRRFVHHVVMELEADYATLMTADFTFANEDLAPLYGLEQPLGPEHELVSLDPQRRAGLLTQSGFLASHAYPDLSSPIHRGVFVQRQVLCTQLPDPPPGIDPALPPADSEAKTTRERVELKTSAPACAGCHSLINPAGYAFEHYDAIGAWRTKDNGEPVDAAGSVPADGDTIEFSHAVDFAHALADSPQAQRCYLTQWYRYGYARHENETDQCTIDELFEQAESNGFDIKELLVAMTRTRAFRYRPATDCG